MIEDENADVKIILGSLGWFGLSTGLAGAGLIKLLRRANVKSKERKGIS